MLCFQKVKGRDKGVRPKPAVTENNSVVSFLLNTVAVNRNPGK